MKKIASGIVLEKHEKLEEEKLDNLFAAFVYKGGGNGIEATVPISSPCFKKQKKKRPLSISSHEPRPRSDDVRSQHPKRSQMASNNDVNNDVKEGSQMASNNDVNNDVKEGSQMASNNDVKEDSQMASNNDVKEDSQMASNNDVKEGPRRITSQYFKHQQKRPCSLTPQIKNEIISIRRPRIKCYVIELDGIEKIVSPYFDIPKGARFICEKELVRGKCRNEGTSGSKPKRKRGNNVNGDDLNNSCEVVSEDVNGNTKQARKKKPRSQLRAAEKKLEAYRRVGVGHNFRPPYSCHHLLQERHCYDPWRVLVISMLLNVTTGGQVAKVLSDFFTLCPDAETTTKVQVQDIENAIRSLGLYRKRAKSIKLFSSQYLTSDWTHVTELHGVGKYAADAYATFCNGTLVGIRPQDHKLVDYWKFVYPHKLVEHDPVV